MLSHGFARGSFLPLEDESLGVPALLHLFVNRLPSTGFTVACCYIYGTTCLITKTAS